MYRSVRARRLALRARRRRQGIRAREPEARRPRQARRPHGEAHRRVERQVDYGLPGRDGRAVRRRTELVRLAVLVCVTVVAYSNSFTIGFPLDNKGLILDDARVHAATDENVALILGHTYW